MTRLPIILQEIAKTGYSADAVVQNYTFADVLADPSAERRVDLAAFTQTPPSYRNAALGVVTSDGRDGRSVVSEHRALGAPLLFVVDRDEVTAWQVRSAGPSREIERVKLDEVPALFSKHRERWNPQSIHRAKSIGRVDYAYQLDFVDIGLLPAIEGEIHAKLDRILGEILADVSAAITPKVRRTLDERALFRTTFRLLAAKILQDRGHELAERWNPDDFGSVITAISRYYRLPTIPVEQIAALRLIFSPAWKRLRDAINFANISADDLAFVYENTLVTPDTRKHFGTHSTPRQVADYVVSRLELWKWSGPADIRVYEPFAGAGVFLVAALRHLKELLPSDWTDRQRHDFAIQRVVGDEKDPFACEVAMLSLILADYPNANGWRIGEVDLFQDYQIADRVRHFNVILCNPPFEPFNARERKAYATAATRSHSKAIAALEAVLDAKPDAIGFVMPHPFILGKRYARQRGRIEELYRDIELVSLPDRVFKASTIRSSLLIAHGRRENARGHRTTHLRSTEVTDRDRFLRSGEVNGTRATSRPFEAPTGDLWLGPLEEVWNYLADNPRLVGVATVHMGVQWKGNQSKAVSTTRRPGHARGLAGANTVHQFAHGRTAWLDMRRQRLRRAIDFAWSSKKIIANSARLSRGPWCIAAAIDRTGLVVSQQLFGIWPNDDWRGSMESLCAVINGPVGSAYVAVHSPADRIRVSALRAMPLPQTLPRDLPQLVQSYLQVVSNGQGLFQDPDGDRARALLAEIDAMVLRAYDLPPRLERELLEFFRGAERPTVHPWTHWFPEDFQPMVPLHEYLSSDYKRLTQLWPLEVFTPLPEDEASKLADALE